MHSILRKLFLRRCDLHRGLLVFAQLGAIAILTNYCVVAFMEGWALIAA